MATKEINDLLKIAYEKKASDLHVKVGSPPAMRLDGDIVPIEGMDRLTPEDVIKIMRTIMSPNQIEQFRKKNDLDFAYSVSGLGRYRCNSFVQRGAVGFVMRHIPFGIPSFHDLMLPDVITKLCEEERGLILVTGITGSGKSTTLASMIDYINANQRSHIITIEDPIEFLHRDKMSILNQREVGNDTASFAHALRAALRQDPDIILVGEMRDLETIETALHAAETGHLVLSTLHTLDAAETINRVISTFPPHQHEHVRVQLSSIIRGIVSQRLLPKAESKGRVPAVEVMVGSSLIKECILDSTKTKLIRDYIAKGRLHYGMQTFDQSIFDHYQAGLVSYEEAVKAATNPEDFKLKVKGISAGDEFGGDEGGDGQQQQQQQQQQKPQPQKAPAQKPQQPQKGGGGAGGMGGLIDRGFGNK